MKYFLYICILLNVLISRNDVSNNKYKQKYPTSNQNIQHQNFKHAVTQNQNSKSGESVIIKDSESKEDITIQDSDKYVAIKNPMSKSKCAAKIIFSSLFGIVALMAGGFFVMVCFHEKSNGNFVEALMFQNRNSIDIFFTYTLLAIPLTFITCCIRYQMNPYKIFKEYKNQQSQILINNSLNINEVDVSNQVDVSDN